MGSDADLVIFDPNRKHTISAKTHHMRVDYSMFEGIEVTGMPDVVLSRGRVVVEADKFVGRAGAGEFLKAGAVLAAVAACLSHSWVGQAGVTRRH